MKNRLIPVIVLAALGCGYALVDSTAVFGPEVRNIEIRPFENASPEPGFERMLTDSLAEEFARRGVLTPLYGEQGTPDLILRGAVTEIETIPSAFSSVSLAVEDRIIVHVDVAVLRVSTQLDVWTESDLTFSERFLSSPDPGVYESNKGHALRKMSADIASRIHDELFQQF